MSSVSERNPSRPALFTWLRLEGLAVMLLSLMFYRRIGESWWLFAALFLAPDLSMLLYLVSREAGSTAYNLVHSYVLPLAILTIALWTRNNGWAPLPLIWAAHIGFDRALGYGLKYPGSFRETHLGSLGTQS